MVKKNKAIDDYIEEAKGDISVRIILILILFPILLYASYKVNWYYLLLFELFIIPSLWDRIEVYFNIKKIRKYLINQNQIEKIEKIDYWNEKDYFLTEKYMIIIRNGKINSFKYDDINSIRKYSELFLKKHSYYDEFLEITLNNGLKYKILTYTTTFTSENYKDISNYLLEKNSKIVIKEKI